jgi:polar amino acid transport system substrate-binding protein
MSNSAKLVPLFFIVLSSLAADVLLAQVDRESVGKLRITTQEWAPYQVSMPDGRVGGVATESVKRVLDKMKVDYEITIYPWARAQLMVKKGAADAFFSASRNNIRDEFAVISDPIAPQSWYRYWKIDAKIDPTAPDFKKTASVGAMLGSNMLEYLYDNQYKRILATPLKMDQLIKMLDTGRIDAALVNDIVMQDYFEKSEVKDGQFKKVLTRDSPLGIYFSREFVKNHPWFLSEFNQQLKRHD